MNLPDMIVGLLEEKRVIAFVTLVGLLAAIAKLFDLAVPAVVQLVAAVSLVLAMLYAIWVIPRVVARRIRLQLMAEEQRSDAENSFSYMSKRYGVGHISVDVECTIERDGSARVKREVEVVAFSELQSLDTFLAIPEKPPAGYSWNIDLLEAKSKTHGRDVALKLSPPQEGKQSVLLTVSPQLTPGQSLTYQLIQKLPKGLYAVDLTNEELEKRQTPDDYFGWTINRPTRNFSMKIFYPADYTPKAYGHQVRYMSAAPGIPSDSIQHEEQKSLAGPVRHEPVGGRCLLQLDIAFPMLGLIYLIRWQPLSRP
jgi:hypothetical protein